MCLKRLLNRYESLNNKAVKLAAPALISAFASSNTSKIKGFLS